MSADSAGAVLAADRGSRALRGEDRVRVAIVGATGYVGAELIRLLALHPHVAISGLVGRERKGDPIAHIHPHLATRDLHVYDHVPDDAEAVFLALSVETELDLGDMEEYQRTNGFSDIRFAVMSPELLAAMDAAFGTSALNPPSTPKVAVAADGTAGDLVTGAESAEEILSSLGLR